MINSSEMRIIESFTWTKKDVTGLLDGVVLHVCLEIHLHNLKPTMKTQFVLKMILQFLVDNPYLNGGIMEFIVFEDPPIIGWNPETISYF